MLMHTQQHALSYGKRNTFPAPLTRNHDCETTPFRDDGQPSTEIDEHCLRFLQALLDSLLAITSIALTFAPSNNTKCLALRHAVQKTARAAGALLRRADWPFWTSQR